MEKANKGSITLIGEGTYFEGTINVPHCVRIDGSFKGKIETTEILTIGNTGVVEADIIAKSAIIGGKVVGNLVVEDRVELDENSSLIGDLKTKDLIIKEGAIFHGTCAMENSKADII